MKKILLINDHFFPEIGSAANLFLELGKELLKNGYQVKVLTVFPRVYNLNKPIEKYRWKLLLSEYIDGIEVIRIRGLPIPKDSLLLRGFEHFIGPIFLFLRGLFIERPDIILVYSPPLPLAFLSWFLSKIKGANLVTNIQDLYPQTVIDIGLLRNRTTIELFRWMENFVYRYADFLTVHSENNRNYLIEHGASNKKVKVIYNWVDIDFIKPLDKIDKFGCIDLRNKFVVSYAGILSIAQGLDLILNVAKKLESIPDILFLIAGDGFEKEKILKQSKDLNLKNVIFLPFQPLDRYRILLSCSDVSLVALSNYVATPVVPGKLASIMASGKAVIASIPIGNDTEDIIRSANCGIVVRAGDIIELSEAILKLYKNPELSREYGRNGRYYAENNFSAKIAANKYLDIFGGV
jgi:colanic acid biosynthesis glycosyl transferase WcaI